MSANDPGPATPAEPLTWSELLSAYRRAPSEHRSAVLIGRLGPWLTNARKTLSAVPPFADAEDVAQQLILEVLWLAARWQPGSEDQWIPRKLVEAATRRVRRSLRRERGHPTVELEVGVAADAAEPELLLETPIGKASVADLQLVYRYAVLGDSLHTMAHEAGITPRQMRRRIQKAKERARA
jgi:DNA-directed RNA polymerase specialized sigma24 family protein